MYAHLDNLNYIKQDHDTYQYIATVLLYAALHQLC